MAILNYRAWDEDDEEMIFSENFDWLEHYFSVTSWWWGNYIQMQDTWLIDKNGKKIFEWDVSWDMYCDIVGPDVIWRFKTIDGKGNTKWESQYPYHNFELIEGKYKYKDLEIIWNIYEKHSKSCEG